MKMLYISELLALIHSASSSSHLLPLVQQYQDSYFLQYIDICDGFMNKCVGFFFGEGGDASDFLILLLLVCVYVVKYSILIYLMFYGVFSVKCKHINVIFIGSLTIQGGHNFLFLPLLMKEKIHTLEEKHFTLVIKQISSRYQYFLS